MQFYKNTWCIVLYNTRKNAPTSNIEMSCYANVNSHEFVFGITRTLANFKHRNICFLLLILFIGLWIQTWSVIETCSLANNWTALSYPVCILLQHLVISSSSYFNQGLENYQYCVLCTAPCTFHTVNGNTMIFWTCYLKLTFGNNLNVAKHLFQTGTL